MMSLVKPQWPGHVPGRFYFGMENQPRLQSRACGKADTPSRKSSDPESRQEPAYQSYGVRRILIPWGQWNRALRAVASAHRDLQLPWISVRTPIASERAWRQLTHRMAHDMVDAFGRELATSVELPVIVTFHDEPDGSAGGAVAWADAYCRFHDILAETTGLRLITPAPIVSDWWFNPANPRRDPGAWLTKDVLSRISLLGMNVYENASGETFERRIPRILSWLEDAGFGNIMIGVAGSGRTAYAPPYVPPDRWLNDSLGWVAKHTDKVGVVCYSSSVPEQGVYWPREDLAGSSPDSSSWIGRAITQL